MTGVSTSYQNRAHRNDLTWAKVGPSEYMRPDGMTIRKTGKRWAVILPSGAPALRFGYPLTAHSLTWAKLGAAEISD